MPELKFALRPRLAHFVFGRSSVNGQILGIPKLDATNSIGSYMPAFNSMLYNHKPDASPESELLDWFICLASSTSSGRWTTANMVKVAEASRSGQDLVGLSPLEREVAITNKFALGVALAVIIGDFAPSDCISELTLSGGFGRVNSSKDGVHRLCQKYFMPYGAIVDETIARDPSMLRYDALAASVSRVKFIVEPRCDMKRHSLGRFERIRASSAKLGLDRLGAISVATPAIQEGVEQKLFHSWIGKGDRAHVVLERDPATQYVHCDVTPR